MRGEALLFLLLVVCLIAVAGCQKPTTQTTTTKAIPTTTARPTVTSTTLPPEKTEMDSGISEISSIENDLDMTGFDDMDKDLASLNW